MSIQAEMYTLRCVSEGCFEIVDLRVNKAIGYISLNDNLGEWTMETFAALRYVESLELSWIISQLNAKLRLTEKPHGQIRTNCVGCSGRVEERKS